MKASGVAARVYYEESRWAQVEAAWKRWILTLNNAGKCDHSVLVYTDRRLLVSAHYRSAGSAPLSPGIDGSRWGAEGRSKADR